MIKKNINRVLLIIVLLIWSKVIYSYSKKFFSKKNTAEFNVITDTTKISVNDSNKEFDLTLSDRDPFLGIQRIKNRTKKNKRARVKKPSIRKEISWPKIEFLGFLRNGSAERKIAILKVNDKVMNVKEKSIFKNSFQVNQVSEDFVIIKTKKEEKKFKRVR